MDWSSQKVFITGHTGFKGSWLTQWMIDLGADVVGYSLEPNTSPSLFKSLELETKITHHIDDIRNYDALYTAIEDSKPNVIFHLAAQPLVRLSYKKPIETWDCNVQGTLHLLEAVRQLNYPCLIIVITTDKVYENCETGRAYRETDRLGGHDPYSASKAACELLIKSYKNSFFDNGNHIKLASARAGNVIGGGDWAQDRIVPDIIKALSIGAPIELRNPNAVRPWQHVLDPLGGYIKLAESLMYSKNSHLSYNFGPEIEDVRSVKNLVEAAIEIWPGKWISRSELNHVHEANLLSLSIEKAKKELNWRPVWNFDIAMNKTISWYKSVHEGANARDITRIQIEEFSK